MSRTPLTILLDLVALLLDPPMALITPAELLADTEPVAPLAELKKRLTNLIDELAANRAESAPNVRASVYFSPVGARSYAAPLLSIWC